MAFLVIDGIWLTLTVSKFYRPNLSHLWKEEISFIPAIIFYLLYALALSIVLIMPAIQNNYNLSKIFFMGFMFGLAAYGAYDITNHATLHNWPWSVTIVDMLWGATLTGTVSCIAFKSTQIWN